MEKKRVIVDYRNITQEQLEMLTSKYPYGFDDFVIKFKNAKGETVSAVPLETEDTKYLVKVSIELERKVEAFLDDEENLDSEEENNTDSDFPEEETSDDD